MSNIQTIRSRWFMAAAVLVCCVGCDQATKNIATRTLRDAPAQSYFGDTVRLGYELNPGGFLSVGSNLTARTRQWIFVGFNTCIMLGLCGLLLFNRRLTLAAFACFVLILAGGIGNLIDRVTNNGLVTDFINLGIGPVRTGVFNVADIAVTCGGLLAIYLSMREKVSQPTDPLEADAADSILE